MTNSLSGMRTSSPSNRLLSPPKQRRDTKSPLKKLHQTLPPEPTSPKAATAASIVREMAWNAHIRDGAPMPASNLPNTTSSRAARTYLTEPVQSAPTQPYPSTSTRSVTFADPVPSSFAAPERNLEFTLAPGVTVSRDGPSTKGQRVSNPLQDAMSAVEQALAAAAEAAKMSTRGK
jgi:hypothetical protein